MDVVPVPMSDISRGAADGKIPGKMEHLLQIMWVFCSPTEREGALQAKLIKFFINNMHLSWSLAVESGFRTQVSSHGGKCVGNRGWIWGYFPYPALGNQSWVVSHV